MKQYLKVAVTAREIKPLKRINGVDEYRVELKRKKSNEQIWKVESFEKAIEQIETHNKYIRDGIRHHDRPTPRVRTQTPTTFQNTNRVPTSTPKEIDSNWNWKKVNKKIGKELRKLYESQQWGPIMKIHNDLKLTEEYYCCDGYKVKIVQNMDKAIKDGII